ncbi:MAG: hypothetical protein KG012_09375 [Deltaproteobacteria bacterium]|nr:hypothetical protein [Deltaproteobacteria bacterium]
MDNSLIDGCLEEIGKGYRPGLLPWLKQQPARWRRLLNLEDAINKAALGGGQVGLTAALSEYKDFFREMVTAYEMSNTFPLFEGRANE